MIIRRDPLGRIPYDALAARIRHEGYHEAKQVVESL